MAFGLRLVGLRNYATLVQTLPRAANQAARLAINTGARRGRAEGSRRIRGQVNFTAGYLNQPGRFQVSRFAKPQDLSAVIAARTEPTSLARFATQATRGGKRAGLRIGIQRGGGKAVLRSGFFINLRAGNRGVAIREAVANKVNLRRAGFSTRASKRGYLLLYGPSVDQVFRTVKDDMSPALADFMNTEFNRQFARLTQKRR
ncbi:hypothetical protein [Candidatus Macondimonas diazotrophica]|jgi:hypothetical protein|uniref:Uncharacterized protein n=1 Tax=Candidatus Macondimonas diazotrophica TaxID=2305248 RepID=A0A4Z0F7E5_9GAMM|nr:hypothetical protein [Candidatus Macondimonas diazotrophica]TFZ81351.1 hypothetical protein E4680_12895 [Candidatus Macondimonas diazotrophica]